MIETFGRSVGLSVSEVSVRGQAGPVTHKLSQLVSESVGEYVSE